MRQRHPVLLTLLLAAALQAAPAPGQSPGQGGPDPLTGSRSRLARDWLGIQPIAPNTDILVMPGHADSQGIGGPGTRGEAVERWGAQPMQEGISDELYWNLLTAQAIVQLGQERGLRIRYYDPAVRAIASGDDPRTTWSVGRQHAALGGYALEIHYDAYGSDGVGSGLIVPLHRPPTRLDESLAEAFGSYPMWFRGGLGAPRRGVAILEIGKLEGTLEAALRDPNRSTAAIHAIAERVVQALVRGLEQPPVMAGTASGSPNTTAAAGLNP